MCLIIGQVNLRGTQGNFQNGYGVAALAFLAGSAVERAIRKVGEVAKEIFLVDPSANMLTILDPTAGHVIQHQAKVHVVVDVAGNLRYVTATRLQTPLVRMESRIFAAAALGDQPLQDDVVVTYVASALAPPAL